VQAIILLVSLDIDMKLRIQKFIVIGSVFAATLLLSEPAAAFRCGSKLVKDGMHELEVVKICGQPTSVRHLGYAIRSVDIRAHRPTVPGWTISRSPGYHSYPAEVMGSYSRAASWSRSRRLVAATGTKALTRGPI